MPSTRFVPIVLMALLLPCAGMLAGQDEPATRDEVRDSQISPDGNAVAFTRGQQTSDATGRAPAGLWRVPFAGGTAQRLTPSLANDSRPRWSPDGREIAFLSAPVATGSHTRVFVLPSSGGTARAVTTEAVDVAAFEWSPDGRRIAFASRGSSKPGLSIVDADGRGFRSLSAVNATELTWAPDGTTIAAVVQDGVRTRLAIVRTTGSSSTRFVQGSFLPRVSWSPDGATIAVIGPRAAGASRLTLVRPNGRAYRQISLRSDEPLLDAVWTGEGRVSLTFGGVTQTWIELLTPDTSARVTVLPPGIATTTTPPSWSRDGRRYAIVGGSLGRGAEVFAGTIPAPESGFPDTVGARPPPVRRITGY